MSETMPRLFTALAEWGACMLFLLQYSRRLRGPRFWLTAAGALVVQVLWLEGTGSLPVAFWMPAMAVAVGLMFLFLAFCGRSDLLVFSGGLGPTEDDLSKQIVARAFGDTLRFDEAELDKAIAAYQSRDRRFGGVKK